MKAVFSIALGILAAIGGFVDIGDIVFNVAAGAEFGYELLWAVVLGVGGIITYAEMCGRVAAVSKKAVFDVVRERLGLSVGLVALVAGQFVNLMMLTAEIGGVALVLQLIAGLPYHALLVLAFVGLALVLWLMPFGWIERVFGYWGPKDLGLNRANALVGYTLGGVLSLALMISAGALLLPKGIGADLLGTVALVAQAPLGQIGLILALVGMLFAISGAAIDSAFAGAYSAAQFFGWEWGKYRHNAGAPRFTLAWIVMLVLGFAIVMTGVDPILVTELSVIFSVVALPLTYLPILLVANDRAYMGTHRNGVVANVFGLFYLVVVLVIAVAAIPLLVLSNMGRG